MVVDVDCQLVGSTEVARHVGEVHAWVLVLNKRIAAVGDSQRQQLGVFRKTVATGTGLHGEVTLDCARAKSWKACPPAWKGI